MTINYDYDDDDVSDVGLNAEMIMRINDGSTTVAMNTIILYEFVIQ